jgi:hypothetical protein
MNARKILVIGLIALFAVMTAFVHFFHVEKGLGGDVNCPACQLQQSALGAHATPVFLLPPLVEIVRVEPIVCRSYDSAARPALTSRAPPAA